MVWLEISNKELEIIVEDYYRVPRQARTPEFKEYLKQINKIPFPEKSKDYRIEDKISRSYRLCEEKRVRERYFALTKVNKEFERTLDFILSNKRSLLFVSKRTVGQLRSKGYPDILFDSNNNLLYTEQLRDIIKSKLNLLLHCDIGYNPQSPQYPILDLEEFQTCLFYFSSYIDNIYQLTAAYFNIDVPNISIREFLPRMMKGNGNNNQEMNNTRLALKNQLYAKGPIKKCRYLRNMMAHKLPSVYIVSVKIKPDLYEKMLVIEKNQTIEKLPLFNFMLHLYTNILKGAAFTIEKMVGYDESTLNS